MVTFSIYAVQNQEGKWFHAVGYGGYGDTWVEDIAKARLYVKLGQARSRVTYFANQWPQYGVPTIVEFVATEHGVLQEVERVAKAKKKKLLRVESKKRTLAKWRLEKAQTDLQRAQREIDQLKGNV